MARGLIYNGIKGLVAIDGPSGQVLQLLGSGNPVEIGWATKDREVHDVEVRARVVGGNIPYSAINVCPVVRLSLELGHGDVAYLEPPEHFNNTVTLPLLATTLPARGIVLRLNTRNLKVRFALDGVYQVDLATAQPTAVAPPANYTIKVAVSIQPARSEALHGFPYELATGLPVGTKVFAFPMGAREFRIFDGAGNAPPATVITPVALFGGALPVVTWVDPAAWHPIPHDAAGFNSTLGVWAGFR